MVACHYNIELVTFIDCLRWHKLPGEEKLNNNDNSLCEKCAKKVINLVEFRYVVVSLLLAITIHI